MTQFDDRPAIDDNALKAQVDAEIAERLMVEAEDARHIHRRAFRIGGLALLVALDATSEIAEVPTLYRLPGAPHGVRGLVNRHGRVIPVLDLSELLPLQNSTATNPWLLVCGRGDAAVGLMIDSLPERKTFSQSDEVTLAQLDNPMTPYAQAAYQQGKDIWLDIDVETFFTKVFKTEMSIA